MEWFIWRRRFKEETTTHLLPLDWRILLIFWIRSPFILNDTFQQRNDSYTRDVEIKMKHGQISQYTPNVTDLIIPRKAQVVAHVYSLKNVLIIMHCANERVLSFCLDFSTNKWRPRGFLFCNARFWKMQWLCRNRNVLHQPLRYAVLYMIRIFKH